MPHLQILAFVLLPVFLFALAGCGSSSSSATTATTDPLSSGAPADAVLDSGTIFGNISTASGKTGITVTTDSTAVDVDNGQIVATAKVWSDGGVLSGVPVEFSIEAPVNGPATIEAGMNKVATDSSGTAITRIITGNKLITTNVILKAAVKIGSQSFASHATFQIVRGGGVIMFTSEAGTDPGGQKNMLTPVEKEVKPAAGLTWAYIQLIPFKVTDSNGNPRVGVPVTLSVYSITTLDPDDVTVDFLVPPVTEPNQQTITTDSAGQGIFNVTIAMAGPPPDGANTVGVVFKAVTNDATPVTAYIGNSYTLSAKPAEPAEP